MANPTTFQKSDLSKEGQVAIFPFSILLGEDILYFFSPQGLKKNETCRDCLANRLHQSALLKGLSQQFSGFFLSLGSHGSNCKKLLLSFTHQLTNAPPPAILASSRVFTAVLNRT